MKGIFSFEDFYWFHCTFNSESGHPWGIVTSKYSVQFYVFLVKLVGCPLNIITTSAGKPLEHNTFPKETASDPV